MKRTTYANGDSISLSCGCDGCSPAVINGTLCHERGCPDSWRDTSVECRECGCDFMRESRFDTVCPDCVNPCDEETELPLIDFRRVFVGEVYSLEMPFSEVCMVMKLSGTIHRCQIRENGVYLDGGTGGHVTYGEAGVYRSDSGLWANVAE